ncbi:hypothetical protein EBU24_05360, partial [bacterium]|nr:hypothetical protein [bacterium]
KLFSFFLLVGLSYNFVNLKASQLSPRDIQHTDTLESVFNFSNDPLEGQVEVSSSQRNVNDLPLLTTLADILDLQSVEEDAHQENLKIKHQSLLQVFQENVAITNVSGLFDAFNYLFELEHQMLIHKLWGVDNHYDIEEIKSLKNVLKKALKNRVSSLEGRVDYLESFFQVPQEPAASSIDMTGAMLQLHQLHLDEPTLPVLNEEDEEAFLRHQLSTETIIPSDFMQEIAAAEVANQEQLCQACNEGSTAWFQHSCSQGDFLFNQSSSNN